MWRSHVLASFILHYLHKIFQWNKDLASRPIKYGEKLFMADGGQIILGKFIWGQFFMEG